jgi:hypothetical protein
LISKALDSATFKPFNFIASSTKKGVPMMKPNIKSLSFMLFMAVSAQAAEKATEDRLDEVAKRGAHVMPFSLEQTTHIFSKTEKGGIQQVIVKDGSNVKQIELIRQHLSKISQEFMQGDFSDPAKIHGEAMPGLAELRMAPPGRIKIVYRELPNGAEINYSTDEKQLIDAIHQWFDAQLSDHARHAAPGHPHHQLHHKP